MIVADANVLQIRLDYAMALVDLLGGSYTVNGTSYDSVRSEISNLRSTAGVGWTSTPPLISSTLSTFLSSADADKGVVALVEELRGEAYTYSDTAAAPSSTWSAGALLFRGCSLLDLYRASGNAQGKKVASLNEATLDEIINSTFVAGDSEAPIPGSYSGDLADLPAAEGRASCSEFISDADFALKSSRLADVEKMISSARTELEALATGPRDDVKSYLYQALSKVVPPDPVYGVTVSLSEGGSTSSEAYAFVAQLQESDILRTSTALGPVASDQLPMLSGPSTDRPQVVVYYAKGSDNAVGEPLGVSAVGVFYQHPARDAASTAKAGNKVLLATAVDWLKRAVELFKAQAAQEDEADIAVSTKSSSFSIPWYVWLILALFLLKSSTPQKVTVSLAGEPQQPQSDTSGPATENSETQQDLF